MGEYNRVYFRLIDLFLEAVSKPFDDSIVPIFAKRPEQSEV